MLLFAISFFVAEKEKKDENMVGKKSTIKTLKE